MKLNIFDRYEWIAIVVVIIMLVSALSCLVIARYGDDNQSVAGPSSGMIVDDYEYPVPVGSPEIGMRPDGSIGSINQYGRVSSC